ncbi:alpha/beta fold hydrolase [Sporolactobacillus pectinivorans]|uniref:alpha/beta fold hydrolase n=1 Tax=Sporolactobacillus pectinivorans TaxID=1591408 RepID=UPI000C26859B|nr:alpha/beta fold hydrolase [Sporolactobacillus pectinivorans]
MAVHCHYKKTGTGRESIVFFPAAGFSGIEGQNIADDLQQNYQLFLCDLPGYGKNNGFEQSITTKDLADWVVQFFNEEKLDKVHLIGHSVGGFVCLCAAYHYPNRVKSLTLLDSGHFNLPRFPSEMGKSALLMPLLSLLSRVFKRKVYPFVGRYILPSIEESSETDGTQEDFLKFCRWMHLDYTNPYISKAFFEAVVPLKQAGLPFHLCFYQARPKKMLSAIRLPVCLCYASYEGIERKREQFEKKNIKSFLNQPNIHIVKVAGAHYVLWSKESPLPEIAAFIHSIS